MLILSFLILCATGSFSLFLGSLIAVRILLPLTVRECDGVRGGRAWFSCFLDKLSLRVGVEGATGIGLVVVRFEGESNSGRSFGEMGEVTGVEDAMVPPTPVREVVGLIFSGAFLVMEQDVGGMLAAGETRAGLCGEPIAITNGILELDAPLNLRSGGDES